MMAKRFGSAAEMRAAFKWQRVEAPKPWKPKDVGEELVGYFGGRTLRNGNFGQYEVLLVLVPGKGAFTLSGTKIIQLADAAQLERGMPVLVKWFGEKETRAGNKMKDFDLLVPEGEALDADSLPEFHFDDRPLPVGSWRDPRGAG